MERYHQLDDPPLHDYPTGPSLLTSVGGGVAFSHSGDNQRSSKFHHVADLDKFFTRIYRYHQNNGFFCMMLKEILELIQFFYVVFFSTFLLKCVDYEILFADKLPQKWLEYLEKFGYNNTFVYDHKITLNDAIFPTKICVEKFGAGIILMIIVAAAFWLFRLAKVFSHFLSYSETRRFYRIALKIDDNELMNLTWHEVLQRLLSAQKIHQMCIHKRELTELDIYHRILRVENYLVSMINKETIPVKIRLPFFGQTIFFSKSFLFNLEFIFFRGIGSPFEHNWQLREEYKVYGRRLEVAAQLRKRIVWTALVNLIFCPVVFAWRILYAFFDYADIIKRDPGTLGSRRFSNFAKIHLRHFNELEHELTARLNRAYKPAVFYMNVFTSPILTILAKNVAFISGSLLAVLIFCTVLDEDVLKVSHMLTTLTVLGVIVAACRACIPDEHAVFLPENLLSVVISEIHYAPETWKGRGHTTDVRDEFSRLFQYRFSHICEELLSPIATPFFLFFSLDEKNCLKIVDFFRNFTVDLIGVGDVCSFAEMDVRRHGDPQWTPDSLLEPDHLLDLQTNQANQQTNQRNQSINQPTQWNQANQFNQPINQLNQANQSNQSNQLNQANQANQANQGKTELSLIHFKLMNPEWKMKPEAVWFLEKIREQVEKEAKEMQTGEGNLQENAVLASLMPLGQRVQGLMCGSMFGGLDHNLQQDMPARGNLRSEEGSLSGSGNGSFLHTAMTNSGMECSTINQSTNQLNGSLRPLRPLGSLQQQSSPLELTAADMSFSALFMHELHRKRIRASLYQYGTIGEEAGPGVGVGVGGQRASQSPSPPPFSLQRAPQSRHSSLASRITTEEEEEGTPLLDLRK